MNNKYKVTIKPEQDILDLYDLDNDTLIISLVGYMMNLNNTATITINKESQLVEVVYTK